MQLETDLSEQSFRLISQWLYQRSGIHLGDEKKVLVKARLAARLRDLQLGNFEQYLDLITSHSAASEQQIALNSLTTNETYFFREEAHFEFLQRWLPKAPLCQPLRCWSAAASSGQEAYSLAMMLADKYGFNTDWNIQGTDINSEVVQAARRAVYPLAQADRIPLQMLQKYCRKGRGKDSGSFMVTPELRQKVQFFQLNLMQMPAETLRFDVILLRNVLIYFKAADRKYLISQLLQRLKPGGLLLVGHTESINGYDEGLKLLQPACYQWLP
ncbi:protein-glutamate O-methyltransferase CheR [Rheinheimera sp.]|uniref:CheR family methyltransferase n=1 Tax=Rheinheimera sp. TaxID=1869214 RepID=UPI00307E784B